MNKEQLNLTCVNTDTANTCTCLCVTKHQPSNQITKHRQEKAIDSKIHIQNIDQYHLIQMKSYYNIINLTLDSSLCSLLHIQLTLVLFISSY